MRTILVVRDGWGYTEETDGNAVYHAHTPNNDRYLERYPWTLLKCTGNAVGVPEGIQGGSEPGHLTIGAGRVVWQPLEEINRSIRNGSFYDNKVLQKAVRRCKNEGDKLHLMGLHSDQGIHATTHHLYALLELARRESLGEVYIHCFLDGRDVPERSAKKFLIETLDQIKQKSVGSVATLVGRYYAMDRDNNWLRTRKAYDLITLGKGHKEVSVLQAIDEAYKRSDKTDYYLEPIVIANLKGESIAVINNGDTVIFWNFRSDRARQITYALTQLDFDKFPRSKHPKIHLVCMSVYDKNLDLPAAFPQREINNNLGQVLSTLGLKQLRIAETEKYAHVTFFFNSQTEKPYPGEDRILVPSLKVSSYDEKPKMSACEITSRLIYEIQKSEYDFILVNYANGDLVGHSANLQAGIKACEAVDQCIGRVVDVSLQKDYVVLITGDHGNIETMFYPNGEPNPSHGTNLVPFIVISDKPELKHVKLRSGLGLSSIATTILYLLDIERPREMTGQNIIY